MENIKKQIFQICSEADFSALALEIFRLQYHENSVYQQYVDLLKIDITKVNELNKIPFLPISFFKTHKIISGQTDSDFFFQSSGTTGQIRSKHFVVDTSIYQQSFTKTFSHFYNDFQDYCFLALLPLYMEQQHSSLVYMMNHFIKHSNCKASAFFLNDFEKLSAVLTELERKKQKTILFGVSYALMDFAKFYNQPLTYTIVMETGGMKGKRQEMTKQKLHFFLKKYFATIIHSEYGMTELLSQAYSKGNGRFYTSPWQKILIRDRYDPFSYLSPNKIGGINIIDLANINSCCFIETQDLGKFNSDNSFELYGRFDVADTRGCNLMIER